MLDAVKERVELLALELEEEKYRLVQNFVWISAALFVGAMALTFATLTVVYLFWETARVAVLAGVAAFYAGIFVVVVNWIRRNLAQQARPFAATLEEIEEDRQCMRDQKRPT